MDTPEDLEFLKHLEETDPDFVSAYLGVPPEMPAKEKIIFVGDCSEILGVCKNTILNHIKTGKLQATFDKSYRPSRWVIKKSDFDDYRSKIAVVTKGQDGRSIVNFKPSATPKESKMASQDKVYVKATAQNVCDFLHKWEKKDSPGFPLRTICDAFNEVSEQPVNEAQMSNILSSLHDKGIVRRIGKGIYRSSYFVDKEETTEAEEVAVESPVSVQKRPDDNFIHLKKTERIAVEAFIEKYSNPERDFYFTIHELSREYPHLDRTKLGKACSNMCYTRTIDKGRVLGEYVKSATSIKLETTLTNQPRMPAKQVESCSVIDSIVHIASSNLPDDLKKKLIAYAVDREGFGKK